MNKKNYRLYLLELRLCYAYYVPDNPKFHLLGLHYVTSRLVTCRACCAVLVPTWRTTKKQ